MQGIPRSYLRDAGGCGHLRNQFFFGHRSLLALGLKNRLAPLLPCRLSHLRDGAGEPLDLTDPSATLHWNVQVVDFLSQRISVQAEQLSRLNLITFGFLQSL